MTHGEPEAYIARSTRELLTRLQDELERDGRPT
jgi:hypothetical protein